MLSIPSSPSSNHTTIDARDAGPAKPVEPGQRQSPLHNGSLARMGDCVAPGARSSDGLRSEVAQHPGSQLATLGTSNLTGGSASPASQASCQCLTSALSLLETLATQSTQSSAPTVARMLHFKKRALAQCDVLLDCQRCSRVSSFIMLLVVFCEKMVTSYEQVLVILTAQYKARQGQSPENESGSATTPERDEERRMAVKDYDVDMEEQPCVFGSLASMQMRKMKAFLERVKTVLRQWNCDLHVATVVSVEERLRRQLSLFDKNSN